MRKSLFFGVILAAILTVGYFLVPKNESAVAVGGVDKAEVETIVREFILKNPEVLIESLNSYQAKQQQDQQAKSAEAMKGIKDELKKATATPFAGAADGDVIIAEFFDYNCGYCKRAFPTINQVLQEDKKVKVLFMELPILSETSETAARVALAVHAADKAKYFEYHRKLMEFTGNKTEEQLLKFVEEVGLDKEKIKGALKSEPVEKELAFVKELAGKIGVRGTPAFIVGEQLIPGAVDAAALKKAIEDARKK